MKIIVRGALLVRHDTIELARKPPILCVTVDGIVTCEVIDVAALAPVMKGPQRRAVRRGPWNRVHLE
jgi:hypothetical protein